MTRFEIRRQKRRKQKIKRARALIILILAEILTAAVPTALLAAIIFPLAHIERGYYAIGSEWFITAFVFCGTFYMIHNKICDKIFKEE